MYVCSASGFSSKQRTGMVERSASTVAKPNAGELTALAAPVNTTDVENLEKSDWKAAAVK
jgi:hypothetical protein